VYLPGFQTPLFASLKAEIRELRSWASLDVGRQSHRKLVEQEAHAARHFQILMHHEPAPKRLLDRIRQHLDELGRTARNVQIASAFQ
jgi:hypothetical protein